jgi:hypothetical protein
MINPIVKIQGFGEYDLNYRKHPNKPVTRPQVEDESVVPEPSCVVNISKEYYAMMNCFTATNLPD